MNFTVTETHHDDYAPETIEFDTAHDVQEHILDALGDVEEALNPNAAGMTLETAKGKVASARNRVRSTDYNEMAEHIQKFVPYPGGMFVITRK